jgi:hypothetical protein
LKKHKSCRWHQIKKNVLYCSLAKKKCTSGGIRTRNPRIRSPMRYPLRHRGHYDPGGDKKK